MTEKTDHPEYRRLREHGVPESDLDRTATLLSQISDLPRPSMYPVGDPTSTGVRLEWSTKSPDREVSIEVSGEALYFHALDLGTGQDEELDGNAENVVPLLRRWLLTGVAGG